MKRKIILDPIIQSFVDSLKGGTPIYKLSPQDARKVLEDVQAGPVDTLPADIQDLTIPVGPKGNINIRIIRPKGNNDTLPVIIWIHGGGWVLGRRDS